jgi:DNA-directed RNA polymerase delta subunit
MEVMKHFVMAIKGISTKQNILEDLKKQLKFNEVVGEVIKHAQKF